MKTYRIAAVAVLVAGLCTVASGATDELIQGLARETGTSMALVDCTFEDYSAVPRVVASAICIDASGEFVSVSFSTSMLNAKVKECVLLLPGGVKKPLQAKLMRIDRVTGLGFIKCTDPAAPKWKAVTFAPKTDFTPGMQVVSVGIMPGDPANTLYYGSATVSSVIKTPQPVIYVTGGCLTNIGSPVFATPNQAVGIVGRQLGQGYDLVAFRQRTQALLTGYRDTAYFTPAEEIFEVIVNREKGLQMSWTGVTSFNPVDMETLGLSTPGVRVGKVIPGYPADKAGLKETDIIVQLDGKDLEQMPTPEMTATNFRGMLLRMQPGRSITLTLQNGNKPSLVLMPMPTRPSEAPRYFARNLGLYVREKVMMDNYLINNPSAETQGLLVFSVIKDSTAEQGGLLKDDVIVSINAQPVRTVDTIKAILDKVAIDAVAPAINVEVRRGAETKSLSIQIPR